MSEPASAPPPPPAGAPRLLVALLDVAQEFQRFQASDARRMGEQLGCEIELLFGGNSARVQEQQLREVAERPETQRPAVILAQPVGGDALEPIARQAVQRGIGWVLLNRRAPYLAVLRREHPHVPVAGVSADQLEIGRIQGRQLRSTCAGADGPLLYVQGPPETSAAQDRLKGTREAMGSSPLPLELVEGDWTEPSGFAAVSGWLRSRRASWRRWMGRDMRPPVAVACQNDQMALGARRALRAGSTAALPPVFGVDGLPEGGQRLVDLGELAATVVVPPNTGPAIHLVVRSLREGTPLPAEVLMSPLSYPPLRDRGRPRR